MSFYGEYRVRHHFMYRNQYGVQSGMIMVPVQGGDFSTQFADQQRGIKAFVALITLLLKLDVISPEATHGI